MAKLIKPKIENLTPDDHNFNKGSEYGNHLIEKSFREFGAGRSILLDRNNRIIAGNKSIEAASSIGMENDVLKLWMRLAAHYSLVLYQCRIIHITQKTQLIFVQS